MARLSQKDINLVDSLQALICEASHVSRHIVIGSTTYDTKPLSNILMDCVSLVHLHGRKVSIIEKKGQSA